MVALGKPVWGFRIEVSWPLFRFVAGPIAIYLVARDMDAMLGEIQKNLLEKGAQRGEKGGE